MSMCACMCVVWVRVCMLVFLNKTDNEQSESIFFHMEQRILLLTLFPISHFSFKNEMSKFYVKVILCDVQVTNLILSYIFFFHKVESNVLTPSKI